MARQPRLLRRQHRVVGMAQRQLGLAPEGQAGVGRQHALGRALQQPRRQLAFQPADLLAERRRHHAECCCSLAEAAVLDDLDEVAQLPQFHGPHCATVARAGGRLSYSTRRPSPMPPVRRGVETGRSPQPAACAT
jgi:hypothetical protein